MKTVFLDTGAIYAFINRNDADHMAVASAYHKAPKLLTHSAVLMETTSLITKRLRKGAALETVDALRCSAKVDVVHVDAVLADRGWTRCTRYADKDWDWIDCISFEIMEERGIKAALALDKHFRQAGFRLLPGFG